MHDHCYKYCSSLLHFAGTDSVLYSMWSHAIHMITVIIIIILCTQVNDINATDTSFSDETIVTGDDFGQVKLFRFPCIKKGEQGVRFSETFI